MDAVTLAVARASGDKRYSRVIQLGPALGSGQSDTAWINAILATAAGAQVRFLSGQTYILGGKLIGPAGGNFTLDATGATFTGPAADNFFANYSAIAARTVSDAQTLSLGPNVASATANFTSADVGKAIGVLGAGAQHTATGTWYGTCTAVATPTTATAWSATTAISKGAVIRPTAATGNLYWATTAGTTGSTQPTWPTSAGTVTDGTVVWTYLGAVTTATLNTNAQNTLTGQTASVFPARDTTIRIIGGTWNGQNKDAVYQSLASHGFLLRRIDNLTVDRVTLTAPGTPNIGGRYGLAIADCTNVVLPLVTLGGYAGAGVQFQGPTTGVTVGTVCGTTTDDLLAFVTVDGQSVAGSLLGDTDGDITGVTYDHIIAVNASTGLKIASGIGSGNAQRTISQFHGGAITGTTFSGVVNVVDYGGTTAFQGYLGSVYAMTTNSSYPLVNIDAGATVVAHLGTVAWASQNTFAPSAGLVKIGRATSVTIDRLANFCGRSGSGYGVVLTGSSLGSVSVRSVRVPSYVPTFYVVHIATAGVTVRRIAFSDIDCLAASTKLLDITAGATGLSLGAVATPSNGPGVDLSTLSSPSDGDIAYNSNAALSCGTGPAIFHTGGTGTGWKNLYSGATY